ncbi:hypothetical protein R5W23_001608 [Gemmata sp. JC673]|uniref:Zinc finger/thioredoxin putative domain-containing protein n=1 Tax=Gemmata algarum TaxID=2975278 RepID=A0ABU5EZJ6_9BACT|nr:MJ0042-type zinc finger domain-containing protein [Gemmata algarum]MDY3560374.1 hypothetical protein [Gemmata algarum]
MNNTCPSCGVLYNVADKDIGRRLKCKKCGTRLTVTEAGLTIDDSPPRDTDPSGADLDDAPAARRRKPPVLDPLALLAAVGGVPGVLFGAGIIVVLFFTSLRLLSVPSDERAAEYTKKVALAEQIELRELLNAVAPDKRDPAELEGDKRKEYEDKKKKIEDRYFWKKKIADEDKRATEIGNRRTKVFEGYGTMFGFVLLAFGCLGFLRTQDALLMRIVAGVILTAMVLGLFRLAIGAGAGFGAAVNLG